ncbi:MAG: hypothetical protein ACOYOV_18165 [Bacteroidales bacterium]
MTIFVTALAVKLLKLAGTFTVELNNYCLHNTHPYYNTAFTLMGADGIAMGGKPLLGFISSGRKPMGESS